NNASISSSECENSDNVSPGNPLSSNSGSHNRVLSASPQSILNNVSPSSHHSLFAPSFSTFDEFASEASHDSVLSVQEQSVSVQPLENSGVSQIHDRHEQPDFHETSSHHHRSPRVLMRISRIPRESHLSSLPENTNSNTSNSISNLSTSDTPNIFQNLSRRLYTIPSLSPASRSSSQIGVPVPNYARSRLSSGFSPRTASQFDAAVGNNVAVTPTPGIYRLISSRNFTNSGPVPESEDLAAPIFFVGIRALPPTSPSALAEFEPDNIAVPAPTPQTLNALVTALTSALEGSRNASTPTTNEDVSVVNQDVVANTIPVNEMLNEQNQILGETEVQPAPSSYLRSLVSNFFTPQSSVSLNANRQASVNTTAMERERWVLYIIALPGQLANTTSIPTSNTLLPEDQSEEDGVEENLDSSSSSNIPPIEPQQIEPDEFSDVLGRLVNVLFSAMIPQPEGTNQLDLNGYEQLLRLADFLGTARARNVGNQADLESQVPVIVYNRSDVEHFTTRKRKFKSDTKETNKRLRTSNGNFESENTSINEDQETQNGDKIKEPGEIVASLLGGTREKCAICLLEYVDGDQIRTLSCRHGYHKSCFDEWVVSYVNSCPICRVKCVEDSGQPDSTRPTTTDRNTPRRPNIFLRVQLDRNLVGEAVTSPSINSALTNRSWFSWFSGNQNPERGNGV
ncbi:E3 ubiquitin-protein ligase znrf3, partial [Nowakowskiella sp. JEL0078]